LNRIFVR